MPEIAYFILGDFPCSIWKHPDYGHLMGYIGVPRSHPWYGKDCNKDDELDGVDVHGDLSYSHHEDFEGRRPPHDTGMDIWWLGFDCAHAGDLSPGLVRPRDPANVYRDEAFVRRELAKLVSQAAAATSGSPR